MRPLPRQKIYKIFFLDFIIDFFSFNLKKTDKVETLEKKIIEVSSAKFGMAINRGRIGAYLAIKAIITPTKNKIILSPFTIFDVINMVICAGGVPVFADVNKESITIGYDNINKVYTKDVAGILITHNHKLNQDIDKIINFKNEKNIYLIEDCAISFGTNYKNNFLGTLGDIGFYSFGMFKFVSSLNGGFIVTDNKKLYESFKKEVSNFIKPKISILLGNFFKSLLITFCTQNIIFKYVVSYIIKYGHLKNIKLINNFSKNDPKVKKIKKLNKNYKVKISNYQAVSIVKQLNSHSEKKRKRKENAKIYYNELKTIKEIIIPKYTDNTCDGWINYPIQYANRNHLLSYLFMNNRDIAKYFYRNCNELEIFSKYHKKLPNIKAVVNNLIILPTYPEYDNKQIYKNINLIKKYFKN